MENATTTTEVNTATPTATKLKRATTKKTKAKAEVKPIGKAQIRILKALTKSKNGALGVTAISTKSDVPKTHISGFVFFATKAKKDKGYVSLAERGLVKEVIVDVNGKKERLAQLTAAGKKAAASA